MRIIRRTFSLLLILQYISWAEDVIFRKSTLTAASGSKPTAVDLVISDVGVIIRRKTSLIYELPYSAINKVSYTFMDRRRASLVPVFGVSALFLKGQSHWLVIESSAGSVGRSTVLRLDKTEYHDVIATLNARFGRRVEFLEPGSALADPTVGSQDKDETVSFHIDRVRAALTPAMEQYSCKLGKPKPTRIECRRGLSPRDAIGGGEVVTVFLEPKGQDTRVQIKTHKGMGRNWSSPIYREMLSRLQSTR